VSGVKAVMLRTGISAPQRVGIRYPLQDDSVKRNRHTLIQSSEEICIRHKNVISLDMLGLTSVPGALWIKQAQRYEYRTVTTVLAVKLFVVDSS
jgi:hypothetical protein